MYCKKCGKEIPDDSTFCNHCGTRQTPKKIVVEFNKPSLPSISQDSIRNGIFSIGRCIKRCWEILKPYITKLLLIGLIIGATYIVTYYSYYLYNMPPEASVSDVSLYREKGVTIVNHPAEGKWPAYSSFVYENPSHILPHCQWEFDELMNASTSWYNGIYTDINESRIHFLERRCETYADEVSLGVFIICFIYYAIFLFKRFRKWLYKK